MDPQMVPSTDALLNGGAVALMCWLIVYLHTKAIPKMQETFTKALEKTEASHMEESKANHVALQKIGEQLEALTAQTLELTKVVHEGFAARPIKGLSRSGQYSKESIEVAIAKGIEAGRLAGGKPWEKEGSDMVKRRVLKEMLMEMGESVEDSIPPA